MPHNVSKAKAKKILSDRKVNGKPLTKAQQGYFGARAGGAPGKKSVHK
jgi:hypothetical protein